MHRLCNNYLKNWSCLQLISSIEKYFGLRKTQFPWPRRSLISNDMTTLESLKFDNVALQSLPLDPVKENFVRQVPNACFSLVEPTAIKDPEMVAYSKSALSLIDLDEDQAKRPEFIDFFSGNKKFPGSQTAAHCYCGHQFGSFAGQLGDGAAISLGEVVNKSEKRWEMQLKGAGKTPFSRSADGRKVLRSSIREFLCSEAMHHLGIPTTRAGCCITSDSKVIRDIYYNGNPIYEKCTVVLRLSPSFIRFGSFEIVRHVDPLTGRRGPSAGNKKILIQLLDYVIKTFYPHIEIDYNNNAEERYLAFYKEVIIRTAQLVAEWQCVGFCHGVLNTDNMSILGLTIDYGPFGFMDHFNADFVCNMSDEMGRYSFKAQPEICKWNLMKLAEALADVLPLNKSRSLLDDTYDEEFNAYYHRKMRKKLGLLRKEIETDGVLVKDLLRVMEETGADFTNVFRCLSKITVDINTKCKRDCDEVLKYILTQCLEPSDLPNNPGMSEQLQLLLLMMRSNPSLASQFQGNAWIQAEKEKMEKAQKFRDITPQEKRKRDEGLWLEWIGKYKERLQKEFSEEPGDINVFNAARIDVMNQNNPRFILRNYIAENAIKAAEEGDYSLVNHVLSILESPYSDSVNSKVIMQDNGSASSIVENERKGDPIPFTFDDKVPRWAHRIQVS